MEQGLRRQHLEKAAGWCMGSTADSIVIVRATLMHQICNITFALSFLPTVDVSSIFTPVSKYRVDQLRPHSRGSVHLRSPRPTDNPVVQFNYLSDDRDVAELVDGFKTAQELLSQPAFDKFRGSRGIPSNKISSDAEIEHFVRTNSGTDYHPCGTYRMSGDEDDELAVVDSTLRVRGLEKLHIADASVIPNIVSGNLNAPVQMIAMKAADMLLKRTPSVQKRPKFHLKVISVVFLCLRLSSSRSA